MLEWMIFGPMGVWTLAIPILAALFAGIAWLFSPKDRR